MYSTEGIILRKIDVGESDAAFVIYTRDFGKIRALAQGVKKEGAKLRGHLEKMNLVEIALVLGRNGFRLISAELQDYFPNTRYNLNTLKAAGGCLEVFDSSILEGDRDVPMWLFLKEGLKFLDSKRELGATEAEEFTGRFQEKFLTLSGYGPGESSAKSLKVQGLNL